MRISEIFHSLQGEGPDTGVSTVFIRLQGCLAGCKWCDTKYSWGEGGEELSINEIMSRVTGINNCSASVYITGGEPLEQEQELKKLVSELIRNDYWVTVATNGTLPRPTWWNKVIWDVDCKCPSSGVSVFDWAWATIGKKNRIKFVVSDETDLRFVEEMLSQLYIKAITFCPTILVSPVIPGRGRGLLVVDRSVEWRQKIWMQKVWNFCIKYNLRYSLQVHKVVFGNRKRGV